MSGHDTTKDPSIYQLIAFMRSGRAGYKKKLDILVPHEFDVKEFIRSCLHLRYDISVMKRNRAIFKRSIYRE